MKRIGLTPGEKKSANLQLKDIEAALGHLLMDTLSGKVAAADLDRLNYLTGLCQNCRYWTRCGQSDGWCVAAKPVLLPRPVESCARFEVWMAWL